MISGRVILCFVSGFSVKLISAAAGDMDFALAARDADNRAAAGTLEKHKVLALPEALLPRVKLVYKLCAAGEEEVVLRLALCVLS